MTIKEIESDGIKIKHKLPISFDNPHELGMAYQTSETIKLTVLEIKPEYLIVLGDSMKPLQQQLLLIIRNKNNLFA